MSEKLSIMDHILKPYKDVFLKHNCFLIEFYMQLKFYAERKI